MIPEFISFNFGGPHGLLRISWSAYFSKVPLGPFSPMLYTEGWVHQLMGPVGTFTALWTHMGVGHGPNYGRGVHYLMGEYYPNGYPHVIFKKTLPSGLWCAHPAISLGRHLLSRDVSSGEAIPIMAVLLSTSAAVSD